MWPIRIAYIGITYSYLDVGEGTDSRPVRFTSCENPLLPIDGRLVGPQNRVEHLGEEKDHFICPKVDNTSVPSP